METWINTSISGESSRFELKIGTDIAVILKTNEDSEWCLIYKDYFYTPLGTDLIKAMSSAEEMIKLHDRSGKFLHALFRP